MKTKRREILDKWFAAFQLSIGLPNEPMTDHAAEYLEAAMEEYANLNSKLLKQNFIKQQKSFLNT